MALYSLQRVCASAGNSTPIEIDIDKVTTFEELVDPIRRHASNSELIVKSKEDKHSSVCFFNTRSRSAGIFQQIICM